MKKILKKFVFLLLTLGLSTVANAQPGFEEDEQPIVPIDGGVSILIGAGCVAVGLKKILKK